MPGEGLIKVMQQVAKGMNPDTEKTDIVKGVITSIEPLTITVKNNAGEDYKLHEDFLLLSPFCKERKISFADITETPHSHEVAAHDSQVSHGPEPHIHSIAHQVTNETKSGITEILLWRGLKVHDRVFLLKVAKGNFYYVLQREGGL